MINAIMLIAMSAITGIHKGAVTHHHDQSITPTSLSTRKTINSVTSNDTPPLTVLVEFPLFLLI